VTCLGGAGLGTVQSLRLIPCPTFILGVDANANSRGQAEVDAFEVVPWPGPGYAARVKDLVEKYDIGIVYAQSTEELLALVRCMPPLPCVIPAGNLQALEVASDKGLLYRFLAEKGVAVPQSAACDSVAALKEAVRLLGYPNRKVVVKPRKISGSRGFHVLDARADPMEGLLGERASYPFLRWEDMESRLRDPMPGLVAMEYLKGTDYTCYALVKEGEPLFVIPCRRLGFDQGVTLGVVSEPNIVVMDYVAEICRAFRFHGFVNVQLMKVGGKPLVYEINPRLSATTVACTATGANVPWLLWQMFTGQDVAKPQIFWGVRVKRSWREEFYLPEGERPVSLAEAYNGCPELC
jgi:carbamoyl-phosphate synthase large subunit